MINGWGRDSIEVRFDTLFMPTDAGLHTINGLVYWDQNKNVMIDDSPDENPANDTLSVSIQVYEQVTDIEDQGNIVREFRLFQNRPNPFNPTTKINYELPITNYINLSVYNITGQIVATLVSEKQQAGSHRVEWDAHGIASGIYYYVLKAGEFKEVKKMVYIK